MFYMKKLRSVSSNLGSGGTIVSTLFPVGSQFRDARRLREWPTDEASSIMANAS